MLIRNQQMLFKKELDGQVVYVALNLSDCDFDLNFNTHMSNLVDVIGAKTIDVNNGNAYVKMPPYSSMIIVSDDIVNNHSEIKPNVKEPVVTEIIEGAKYRHFKGGEYEVIALARHTETQEELVIYKSLSTGEVWARPKTVFVESVGDCQRFTLLR